MYKPKFEHRSQFIELRGLAYHVREWGERDAPPLLMLHGWMDVGASFQFVADHLADRFRV
ncbi:MAG TPA: alpha/beta hydrolase, partial [Burkholderiaceae bacterium]|nr:alpha/beta hydrolase [Burkholderiaceae bacterium]